MIHNSNPSQKVVKAAQNLATRLYRQQAALMVISEKDTGRVLVVRRYKDDQIGLPCGKVDAGEKVRDAAVRELYEETGVKVEELADPLRWQQSVLFEGTLVNVFVSTMDTEKSDVRPADGFEGETSPFWCEPEMLSDTESRFQTFNILSLFNAGLIK